MNYSVIGNIIVFIASLMMVYTGFLKNKKKIIFLQTIQIILYTISNFLLNSIPGVITNILNCIRNILCYKNKLGKEEKIVITILSIVLTLRFNNIGIIGYLPVIISVSYIWLMTTKDVIKFKILIIFTTILWFIHNWYVGLYVAAIFDFSSIIANFISIYQIKNKKMKQKMIDLHLHTNYSDGTDTLQELLEKAENSKLEIISITDHDNVDAYFELEKNQDLRNLYNGQIIIGSELKTYYKDVSIEVLAYGIDYKKLNIHKVDTEKLQKQVLEKFKEILDREGFKYEPQNLYVDKNDPSKQWASFAVASELLKHPENKGLIEKFGNFTVTSFFRTHQCNKNSVFYINENKDYIDLNETIKRIHDAGGLAFLAHPYLYPFEDIDKTIEEILIETDIDGVECEYSTFTKEETKRAKELVKKYDKYMSGGSDYHANNKPDIELGTGFKNNLSMSKDLIEDWIDKVRKI